MRKMSLTNFFVALYFSLMAAAILVMYLNSTGSLSRDSALEEVIEDAIEELTSIDVDLSPEEEDCECD